MNPPVITTIGHADPNAAPMNINQMIDLLNTLVTSEIQGTYIPYIIGNAEPGVDDRDKAWIQTDSQGRPLMIKVFYSGAWRRVYSGIPGEVRGYTGDPSIDFDDDGKGNVGGNWDGWQICNGNNGSPDLSDKFLIGGHMNDSGGHVGYNSGWQTFVNGDTDQKTGGVLEGKIKLNATNTYRPASSRIGATRWSADGNGPDGSGGLAGLPGDDTGNFLIHAAEPGNINPADINVLPPFYALAWVTFVGYSS